MPLIREEHRGEWPRVRALIDSAFAPQTAAGLLADWLHERGAALSMVAESDHRLVGQVLFSPLPVRTGDGVTDVLCLAPLSVDPGFRHRGIARTLVAASLAALADRPEPLVVLEGDPAMYRKFGFRPASGFGVARPSELIPEPAFQAAPLPRYSGPLGGRLEYPQYFFDIGAVGP